MWGEWFGLRLGLGDVGGRVVDVGGEWLGFEMLGGMDKAEQGFGGGGAGEKEGE